MSSKQTPGMQNEKQNKADRRNTAREKARLLREQEAKRAKRNRVLAIVGAVLVVLLLVVVGVKITTGGNEATYDGAVRPAKLQHVTADYGVVLAADGSAGELKQNVRTLRIYSDYMCPHCVKLEKMAATAYEKHARADNLQIVQYPVSIMRTDLSNYGTAAAFYVATYDPVKFNDFQKALFEQAEQVMLDNARIQPSVADIAKIATEVGVKADVVKDLPASIVADEWQKLVQEATQEFLATGAQGTPTVTVDGKPTTDWVQVGMPKFLDSLVTK